MTEAERVMKWCQAGTWTSKEANNLHAECYRVIGKLLKTIEELESQELVAWRWHQAPVKTSWGHEMVVVDLAIDKDNTVSVYCERDQTTKVEAMLTHPPQRTWVGLTNDEAKEIQLRMVYGNHPFLNVINAIEAKLKQKNGFAEE